MIGTIPLHDCLYRKNLEIQDTSTRIIRYWMTNRNALLHEVLHSSRSVKTSCLVIVRHCIRKKMND